MENLFKSTLFISLLMTGSANAAFVHAYNLSNWSQSTNGGAIDISGAPDTVFLTSSNDGSGDEKNQDLIITASENAAISFAWNFQTTDLNEYDPFGLLLNGVFAQLSDNLGNGNQTGMYSLNVATGDIFGFRANSVDSSSGSSITQISNFSAVPTTVPVPPTLLLMVCPLLYLSLKKHKSIV